MKKRTRQELTFEMTPLIDVVFLLLIFFMVSSVFKKDELALLLNLPKADSGASAVNNQKSFIIELTENELAVNGRKVTQEELDETLAGLTDKTQAIDFRVDKQVRYERVIDVLDRLKKHGLSNLSLLTSKE
jgi:biopolymer transport protein ExbD